MSATPKMKFSLSKVSTTQVPKSKPRIALPVGCLLDIPGGEIRKGAKGEYFINGGFHRFTGLIGSSNNYKTTIAHHFALKSLERIMESGYPSLIETYDTELTISVERLENLADQYMEWVKNPIRRGEPIWVVTDAGEINGNDWEKKFTENTEEIAKNKQMEVEFTAFKDPYTNKAVTDKIPTIGQVDTLSKLRPNKLFDKLDENDLDSSDTNTVWMNEGMFKKKILVSLPRKLAQANKYMVMTAHVSEKIDIATGPAAYMKPSRQLQYLKAGDSVKGVTSEFRESSGIIYQAHTATLLNNKSTKFAEYPDSSDDTIEVDMNCINMTIVRNKLGRTGVTTPLVVTQSTGVRPELTEFHYIKSVGKFGIEGSNISYNLVLRPEVKLSRTTVKKKIESDKKLARALNFTAEMHQLQLHHRTFCIKEGIYDLTPKDVYDKIIEAGYDWEEILETRGYYLIDQYDKEAKPFLSVIDLLRMAIGTYVPYWYKGKVINNEVVKKAS